MTRKLHKGDTVKVLATGRIGTVVRRHGFMLDITFSTTGYWTDDFTCALVQNVEFIPVAK